MCFHRTLIYIYVCMCVYLYNYIYISTMDIYIYIYSWFLLGSKYLYTNVCRYRVCSFIPNVWYKFRLVGALGAFCCPWELKLTMQRMILVHEPTNLFSLSSLKIDSLLSKHKPMGCTLSTFPSTLGTWKWRSFTPGWWTWCCSWKWNSLRLRGKFQLAWIPQQCSSLVGIEATLTWSCSYGLFQFCLTWAGCFQESYHTMLLNHYLAHSRALDIQESFW